MARLPIPGDDVGSWGGILNDFLSVELNSDGTLKKAGAITTAQTTADTAQTNANNRVPLSYLDTDVTLATNSDYKIASQKAIKSYVDSSLSSGTPDATASTKGKLRLAGDIGGTADVPTVPALANRVIKTGDTMTGKLTLPSIQITGGSPINDYVLMTDNVGNGTWKPVPSAPVTSVNSKQGVVVLNPSDIGLGNVNNTSDASKPISSATQTALNAKESTANKGVANGYAGLDNNGTIPVSQLPNQSGSYIPLTAKGVANGVATLDSNTKLPEAQLPTTIPFANLPTGTSSSTVMVGDDSRVTNALQSSALDTDDTLSANSNSKIASQKATKTYVDNQIASGTAPDATTSSKGILQLTGDLSGSATSPTVVAAAGIKSSSGTVNTSLASAPSSGYFLRASDDHTAAWQAMPRNFGWYFNDDIAVGDGQGPIYRLDADARIVAFDVNAKQPPASTAEFDIQYTSNPSLGFTSVFSTLPTITAGQYVGNSGTLSTINLFVGQYIRFCITSPGGDGLGDNVAAGVTAQLRLQTR